MKILTRLEPFGKRRKEFGKAEGPQGRASGRERVERVHFTNQHELKCADLSRRNPMQAESLKDMANHNNFGTNEVGRARHSVRAVRERSCDGAHGVTRPNLYATKKECANVI